MLRHKQVWLTAGLAATIFVAEAASKKVNQRAIQRLPKSALAAAFQVAASAGSSIYEIRAVHDPHGIGKFYMGREIARVMGPGGISWLDRPEREEEEHPRVVIDALGLRCGEFVADLGAGSGFFGATCCA